MWGKGHRGDAGFTGGKAVVGLVAVLCLLPVGRSVSAEQAVKPSPASELSLKDIPYKLVYETYRQTNGKENWELYLINADGSNPVNLTNTPDLDEMYPHVSPDAKKICFEGDEMIEGRKVRNVYYINMDGSGRVKIADNARQACWSPDCKAIAYAKAEFERYTTSDYATRGLFIYDLETAAHKEHPNKDLFHLYNINWSPDGKWFVATVHGAMGYKHTNLAVEADGVGVYDLGFSGCRPDVSPDGKSVVWCPDEKVLWGGDLDLTSPAPKVTNRRIIFAQSGSDIFQQQADWSPDGRFIAFGRGPQKGGGGRYPVEPGCPAKGWNICIGDLTGKWVEVTTDGNHNKEPDWVPIPSATRQITGKETKNSPLEKILSHPIVQKDS